MKQKTLLAAVLAITSVSPWVCAQDEDFDPKPVIEGRQSALRDIGAAFKGIGDEFKKSTPSVPLIRQYAKQIDELSKQQKFWFPPGTGPETEIDTDAKPAIWEQPEQFKAKQVAMSAEAAKLVTVVNGSDLSAIKTQWQALGKTCKGCHDSYREEDD